MLLIQYLRILTRIINLSSIYYQMEKTFLLLSWDRATIQGQQIKNFKIIITYNSSQTTTTITLNFHN